MNSGGFRAPFPKGEITRGMVYSCLPFENRLVKFEVSGQLMAQILEFVAGKTGKQGSLQVSGLSLAVADGKPKDVLIDGKPFDPTRTYTISTIDYIANGNDGADVFKQVKELHPTGELVRDAMFAYMAKHPLVQQPDGGRIKLLTPVP
jgi:2',3'-cyclic-nucleotide 2'-phosphodiesterase (5'-nucleotidase family)